MLKSKDFLGGGCQTEIAVTILHQAHCTDRERPTCVNRTENAGRMCMLLRSQAADTPRLKVAIANIARLATK